GDLAQAGTDQMLAALLQQGEPCPAPEAPGMVELFVQQFATQAACPRRQFLQPTRPLLLRIHPAASTVDAATTIERLDPIHGARRVLHQSFITVPQLLQGPQAATAVIDR